MTKDQFNTVVLPLRDKLFRYAFRLLKQEADACDMVQECMVKAWEEKDSLSGIRNMEAWCMTVVRNKSLNVLRRKKSETLDMNSFQLMEDSRKSPFNQMEQKDTTELIGLLISELPVNQREVIHLRDVEGYSYREIADMVNLELNHIKVLLHRARKHIRQALIKAHEHGITNAG